MPFKIKIHGKVNKKRHCLVHEYARANSSLMHKVKILALCMLLISQNLSNLQRPFLEARACFKFTQNQATFLSAYTSLSLSIPQEIRWITVWLRKITVTLDSQRFLNACLLGCIKCTTQQKFFFYVICSSLNNIHNGTSTSICHRPQSLTKKTELLFI